MPMPPASIGQPAMRAVERLSGARMGAMTRMSPAPMSAAT